MVDFLRNVNNDFKFGLKNEDNLINSISNCLGCELIKLDQCNTFDFKNKDNTVLVELKTRRCSKNTYYDTMIGYDKVLESLKRLKEDYSIYYVFKFIDGLYYYKFTELHVNWIRSGGRSDRGRKEIKFYYHIPVSELIKIEFE